MLLPPKWLSIWWKRTRFTPNLARRRATFSAFALEVTVELAVMFTPRKRIRSSPAIKWPPALAFIGPNFPAGMWLSCSPKLVIPPLTSSNGKTKGTIWFAMAPWELAWAEDIPAEETDEAACDDKELADGFPPAGLSPPPPLPQATSNRNKGKAASFIDRLPNYAVIFMASLKCIHECRF